MATIERFEDILGWQKARQVTAAIYEATGQGIFSKGLWSAGSDTTIERLDHG